jgi:hypothetical protein
MGLEFILELFDAIPAWIKWAGSIGGGLFIVAILIFSGNSDMVSVPNEVDAQIDEAKDQAKDSLIGAGVEATGAVTKSMDDAGDSMASTVDNPESKKMIKSSFNSLGILFSLLIWVVIGQAIYGIYKSLGG